VVTALMAAAALLARGPARRLARALPLSILAIAMTLRWAGTVVPFEALGLGVIKNGLNPSYMIFAMWPMSVVTAAVALAAGEGAQARWRRWAAAAIVALPLALLAQYKTTSMLYWAGMAGQNDALRIPNLKQADWYQPGYRAVAAPYHLWDMTLLPYGIDTLAGYFNLFNDRIATFWSQAGVGLSNGMLTLRYGDAPCPRRYQAGGLGDMDLLRVGNARYLVSRVPVEGPGLTQISGPGDDYVPACARAGWRKLAAHLSERFAPPAVHVYDIAGALPRVYFATGAEAAGDYHSPDFWARVRAEGPKRVAITETPLAFASGWETAAVTGQHFADDTWTAAVEAPKGGLLVFVSPYLPFWRAEADGRPAEVVPVNGIAMAVEVPPGARQVVLRYQRPTLAGKLLRTAP
jgi:hypothetical protein